MYEKQVAQYLFWKVVFQSVLLLVIGVAVFEKNWVVFAPNSFLTNVTKWTVFANCWNQSFGLDQPSKELLFKCKAHTKVETVLRRYGTLGREHCEPPGMESPLSGVA